MLAAVDLSTTLVVVTGDNGTPPVAAPDPGRAKGTTFERGIRIPLIMAGGPIKAPGRTCAAQVHLVDVYATVNEWLEGGHPGVGESLLGVLANTSAGPTRALIACGCAAESCARDADHKLRRLADGTEQFFVLPDEDTDLIDDPAWATEIELHRGFLNVAIPRR
jgi:hypothetical protein